MILSDKDRKRILTAVNEIVKGKNKDIVVSKLGFKSWSQLYQSAYYLYRIDEIKSITWKELRKRLLNQGGLKRRKLKGKENEISYKYKNKFYTTRELGKEYDVSKATIQKILQEKRVARSPGETNLLRPFSGKDKSRKIRIPDYPEQLNSDLAEYIGIKIADGWTRKDKFNVGFSFNLEEKEYVLSVVAPLINRIYGITPIIKEYPKKTLIEATIYSKKIYNFETKVLRFPKGKKNKLIKIPSKVMASPEFYKDVLRGIVDNDFGTIQVKNKKRLFLATSMKAPLLIPQLKKITKTLGFNLRVKEKTYLDKRTGNIYKGNYLWFPPIESERFLKNIRLKNIRHLSKFMLSKEFGASPTYTTLEERLKCLNGKISFEDLKNISEERKFNQTHHKL